MKRLLKPAHRRPPSAPKGGQGEKGACCHVYPHHKGPPWGQMKLFYVDIVRDYVFM